MTQTLSSDAAIRLAIEDFLQGCAIFIPIIVLILIAYWATSGKSRTSAGRLSIVLAVAMLTLSFAFAILSDIAGTFNPASIRAGVYFFLSFFIGATAFVIIGAAIGARHFRSKQEWNIQIDEKTSPDSPG